MCSPQLFILILSVLDIPTSASSSRYAIITSRSANKDYVYAICGGATGSGIFEGIYKSTNNGQSYVRKTNSPNVLGYSPAGTDDVDQAGYDLCIAASPFSTNVLTIGGINIWGSSNMNNSTSTFMSKTYWHENIELTIAYIHSDQHDLAYDPLAKRLFTYNDGGLFRSTDDGTTWTDLSKGLYISQFYHLAQSNLSSYKYVGGLQDNGVKYRAKGTSDFTHMTGADGFSTSFSPHDPDVFYSTRNTQAHRMKYSDGSQTYLSNWEFFPHILAHPVDSNIVYLGGVSQGISGVWKSTNKGVTFTNKGRKGSWAMAISSSDPTKMYAAGGDSFAPGTGGVYYSGNSGESWTEISSNSGFPNSANYNTVTDIAINTAAPSAVYVTVGGFIAGSKIFYSGDAGQTWFNYSFDVPNVVVHSAAVVADKVYVGTDISLYSRTFGTETWVDVGDNLPLVPITEILPDTKTGRITIATFGRGVWERAYCVANVTLTEDLEGQLDYQSSNLITSSSLISGDDVDAVTFKAGGQVVLTPGFKATEGTYFQAKTSGCVDGDLPAARVDSVSKQ
jgi:hypothetical protein